MTPSREQLLAAYGEVVRDLVGPGMRLLLCGINPSLWSGYAGYHFARPHNRLWTTLFEAGLTPRRLHPRETDELVAAGIGVTNLVRRATARADELTPAEILAGRAGLEALVASSRPQVVAVLGVTAYRVAFGEKKAVVGRQERTLGSALLWVLPNPSGLNAHYQQPDLTRAYAEVAQALAELVPES